MRNLLFIYIFIFTVSSCFSQDNEYITEEFENFRNSNVLDKNVFFKMSFLFPSLGAEIKMGENSSIDMHAKLATNIIFFRSITPLSIVTNFFPIIHIEPKWNYNILKRKSLGKKTKGFSSNFLSIFISYHVPVTPDINNLLVIGPTWGLHRNFGKFGFFKLNTGLGYYHTFCQQFKPIYKDFPILPI